jgi:transposase
MSSPYPYELRIRALKLIEEGMSISKIKELLSISRQTLYSWKKMREERGDIKAKGGYQKGHSHKIRNMDEFKEFIDNNKDKSLKELAIASSGKYSAATIWRGIKKLGYTYKKNLYTSHKR